MNKLKNKRGITLIALIITIIVLLILAGVIINMTLGNDGIITKAQSAANAYQNAQEKEEYEIAKTANEIDTWTRTGQNHKITVTELFSNDSGATSGDVTFSNNHSIDEFDELKFLIGTTSSGNGKYGFNEIGFTKSSWDFVINNGNHSLGFEIVLYADGTSYFDLQNPSKNGFTIGLNNDRRLYKVYGIKY